MITDLAVAIPLAVLCVLVSGFCSGSEVALFSLRRVDREALAHSESGVDRRILRMLERPRRLIATVLIGNEAFNSLLAVIAFSVVCERCPADASPWLMGLVALGITLPLVVLIAEVTSKTLAAKSPLTWSRVAAVPLAGFAALVTPVRVLVQFTAAILLRPLGDAARSRPARDLSEQEFRNLLDAGSAQGQINARERRLIHRVFDFSDKNVGQVMTPRDRIFALAYDLPAQRLVKEIAGRGFSRVPIYQKSLDNIRGIVNAKDLVRSATGAPLGRPLGELLHEPLFVPRTTPIKRLFLTFKQKKVHMALVVSEYGKVLGLVTMDDLLAQIFGSLRDERAALQQSIQPLANQPGAKAKPLARNDINTEATGPVPFVDTGPVPREPLDGLDSAPVPALEPSPSEGIVGVLDPPVRPIHPTDEVTPPAVDVSELRDRES